VHQPAVRCGSEEDALTDQTKERILNVIAFIAILFILAYVFGWIPST